LLIVAQALLLGSPQKISVQNHQHLAHLLQKDFLPPRLKHADREKFTKSSPEYFQF
jgi:hypothetical protein